MNAIFSANWSLAAWIIGISASLGGLVIWRLPKNHDDLWQRTRDTHADLKARYEQHIALLRDLQEQQDRISAQVYQAQKSTYELQAAQTLEAIHQNQAKLDALKKASASANDTKLFAASGASRGQLKGFVWGALTASLLAFLGSLVQSESRPSAPAPNAPVATPQAAAVPAAADAASPDVEKMHTLAEALRTDPDNVSLLLQFAHLLLRAQMLEEAKTINDRALKLAPNDLEALTHAAVLAASEGNMPAAEVGLDTIVKKHPAFSEAWFFRGMLALQQGKTERMRESFKAFIQHAEDGPQKQRVEQMLQRFAAAP